MFPLGFALGAIAGATAVAFLGRDVAQRSRPYAKAAVKAALIALHEAQVRKAEIAEAAEDFFAEAKAEATAEVLAAAMAAARAQAQAQAGASTGSAAPEQPAAGAASASGHG